MTTIDRHSAPDARGLDSAAEVPTVDTIGTNPLATAIADLKAAYDSFVPEKPSMDNIKHYPLSEDNN